MTAAPVFTGSLLTDVATHSGASVVDWRRRVARLADADDSSWPLLLGSAVARATQSTQVVETRDLLELVALRAWPYCPPSTPCPGCAARPQWCWVPRAHYALLEHLWLQQSPRPDAYTWCSDLVAGGQADAAAFVAFLCSVEYAPSTVWASWSWVWDCGSANAYLADAISHGLGVQAATTGTSGLLATAGSVAGDALDFARVLPDELASRLRRRRARADAFLSRTPLHVSPSRPVRPNRYKWQE